MSEKLNELFDEISHCEDALANAVSASEAGIGVLLGRRGDWSAILHARIILNLTNQLAIVSDGIRGQPGSQLLDHFAVVSLARTAIEAALMMLYVSDPSISVSEWRFRRLALDLHDVTHRNRFFKAAEENHAHRDEYAFHIERLRNEIKAHPHFSTLAAEQQERLLAARDYFVGGKRAAIRSAGWNLRETEFYESYFSAFVHSTPVSFYRADQHQIDFRTVSDFQMHLCRMALNSVAEVLETTTSRMNHLISEPLQE